MLWCNITIRDAIPPQQIKGYFTLTTIHVLCPSFPLASEHFIYLAIDWLLHLTCEESTLLQTLSGLLSFAAFLRVTATFYQNRHWRNCVSALEPYTVGVLVSSGIELKAVNVTIFPSLSYRPRETQCDQNRLKCLSQPNNQEYQDEKDKHKREYSSDCISSTCISTWPSVPFRSRQNKP